MDKRNALFVFLLIAFLSLTMAAGCRRSDKGGGTRPLSDTEGGYSTTPEQIEKVVAMAEALEGNLLDADSAKFKGKSWIGGISPHDSHILAGRVYVHLFQNMHAKTYVIFGVAHKAADWGAQDAIIFDSYDYWKGPYSSIKVSDMRGEIIKSLPKEDFVVNDKWQGIEHSVEGILPFLQYYNKDAEIVSILVPYMDWPVIERISNHLATALAGIIKARRLKLGKDIAFIYSNDGDHYGDKDWGGKNSAPFGTDEAGYRKATALDMDLINKELTGNLTLKKLKEFTSRVWGEKSLREYKIRWCGRFSIPFGLNTTLLLAQKLKYPPLRGHFLRYDTSLALGKLPVKVDLKPKSLYELRHWVGYSAVRYE